MSMNCTAVNKTERSWTSDLGIQSSESAHLDFGLALVQCFSIKFWNGNIYPVMLEVCELLFAFNFIGDYS